MKKLILSIFIASVSFAFDAKSQVGIDQISLISNEKTNTQFCFNNTKLMAGNNVTDRYIVYYNVDTIFININQAGIWTKKIAYTGSNIQSANLTFYQDTIWICWKEGFASSQIKARYTPNKGTSWSAILFVSPVGKVSAPSIFASSNGKIHFVWSNVSTTDTIVYYNRYKNGAFLTSPTTLSNPTGQGLWPSVIAIGDTVLCAWKEDPLPSKVWFRSSFNGGNSWNSIPSQPTTTLLSTGKDPNLAYSFDANTMTHYVYLAFDGQNKIYLQRSTNLGNTWSNPTIISSTNKLSQFAHIESNNNGFVGVSYEQRPIGTSLFDDTKKDVGFTYSVAWASNGSFSVDTLAYTFNSFGSAYPAFNKIDNNNFYLAWLTKDTVANKIKVYERKVYFGSTAGLQIINGRTSSNIDIFPNPTNGIVKIKLIDQSLEVIKIYNSSGTPVQEFYTTEFTIENLPSGLYFATIQTDKSYSSSKIIKY